MTPRTPVTVEDMLSRYGERYKWLVLLTVMVGTMASFMSSTIVNVAVPELSGYFTLTQERAQWISAAFMVAMTPALSVTPWLLQRFGLRRTYIGANVLLMTGGVVGGLAGNYNLLIAMRAAEGIAAGILQPIPAIVVMRAFAHNEQGRAMGIFGFGVVLAPAIGPTLGGFLVEHWGWRSIFFVMVPFCVTAIWLARRFLPPVSSLAEGRKPLDALGLVLVSVSTVSILNGLAYLNRGAGVALWALFGVGFGAFAAFVAWELRRKDPLLRLQLFAHRPLTVGAIVSFVYGFGIFGSTYLLPVFLQVALHYTPSQAGTVLLPAGLALGFTMPFAGRLADRMPGGPLVASGLAMLALSLVLTAFVTASTAYVLVVLWTILGRVGLGVIHPALSIGSVKGLDQRDLPQALSMTSFLRQLGGAFGVAMTGVFLDWRLTALGAHAAQGGTEGVMAAFRQTFLALALVTFSAAVVGAFLSPWRWPRGRG